MTRRQRITIIVAQTASYIMPVGLIVIATFRLLPFKPPHGRIGMLLAAIGLGIALAVSHRWQWRELRRREEALRRIFGRMEYP